MGQQRQRSSGISVFWGDEGGRTGRMRKRGGEKEKKREALVSAERKY